MTAPAWSTVMATGHRVQDIPRDAHSWVRDQLDRVVGKLRVEYATKRGYTGMALATDQWWADALHWKSVPYTAHIPYLQQPDRWKQADRDEWVRLRSLAEDEVLYGDLEEVEPAARKRHAVRLLHQRNDGMLTGRAHGRQVVPPADAVVGVWRPDKRDGGTYSALVKAHRMGLPVIHINPLARTVTVPSAARLAELLYPGKPQPLPLPA